MYSISETYRTKMLDKVQTHKLTGTIDGIAFDASDVIGVSYKNQASGKKVNIGGVNIGTLKLTFLNDLLSRGEYYGKVITLSDSLLIAANTWEEIPIGTFYVSEAVWTSSGMIDITAYDVLSLMDKPITFNQSAGKLYDYCHYIELETGASFGLTEEEADALPNGTEIISPYPENNITTFRDLVSALAEFIGGFAYADRNGTWKLRTFAENAVLEVPKDRRISGAKFSDFETLYDGIQFTDIPNNTVKYYGDGSGIILNLGNQPFLQYGLPEVINYRAEAIVSAIEVMEYVPYSVSLLPAFVVLDLGDVVSFRNDYANETTSGAVMSISWTYNKSLKIECYGDNPNIRTGQSATDKNIAGLLSKTNDNVLRYYTFVNVADIEGITEEEDIASFHFATKIDTTVTLWNEIKLNCTLDDEDEPMEIIAHYYLNGVEEAYSPIQTIGESGIHTLDYNYFLQGIQGGLRNEWKVSLECIGGSADIDEGDIHICLSGQGLVGEEAFLGIIEVSDTMPLFVVNGISSGAFSDLASVSLNSAVPEAVSDNIPIFNIGGSPEIDYILDEEGAEILDEEDEAIIAEEPIETSSVEVTAISEAVNVILRLDESFAMRCGDGFYCGDNFDTGLFNTLI